MPCYCCYDRDDYEEPLDEGQYEEYEAQDGYENAPPHPPPPFPSLEAEDDDYEEDPYANMGSAWERQVTEERYWYALQQQRQEAAEAARWAQIDEAWDQYKREEYERDAAGWAECEEALKVEVMKDKAFLEQLEQDEQIQREIESA